MAQKKKKTLTKKAAAPKTKRGYLTKAEIVYFKDLLLQKRLDILGNVNEMHNETLKKSRLDAAGDLSSMPIHMADIGSDTYEQEFTLGLLDSERKILKEIDQALLRVQDNNYGICIATGKPIPKARLEAKPWAKYCVEYARKLELGLVSKEN